MIAKPQPVGLPAFLTLPKGRGFSRFFVEFSSGHAHDHIKKIFPVLKRTLIALDLLPVRTISSVKELMQLIEKQGEIRVSVEHSIAGMKS